MFRIWKTFCNNDFYERFAHTFPQNRRMKYGIWILTKVYFKKRYPKFYKICCNAIIGVWCNFLTGIQQWKHQSNTWNLFKVDNKNTKMRLMKLLWCLYCYFGTEFSHYLNKEMPTRSLTRPLKFTKCFTTTLH